MFKANILFFITNHITQKTYLDTLLDPWPPKSHIGLFPQLPAPILELPESILNRFASHLLFPFQQVVPFDSQVLHRKAVDHRRKRISSGSEPQIPNLGIADLYEVRNLGIEIGRLRSVVMRDRFDQTCVIELERRLLGLEQRQLFLFD